MLSKQTDSITVPLVSSTSDSEYPTMVEPTSVTMVPASNFDKPVTINYNVTIGVTLSLLLFVAISAITMVACLVLKR